MRAFGTGASLGTIGSEVYRRNGERPSTAWPQSRDHFRGPGCLQSPSLVPPNSHFRQTGGVPLAAGWLLGPLRYGMLGNFADGAVHRIRDRAGT
jgi:hypothetical protein